MKYRVVRKLDGFIIARGMELRAARSARAELQQAERRPYIIRPDTGPVERLNVSE